MKIEINQFDPIGGCGYIIGDDFRGRAFDNQNLRVENFRYCDLRGADLSKAIIDFTTCFDDAIFDEHTKMPDIPMTCPEEGEFIGYKKAMRFAFRDTWTPSARCIVKLLIPADAKRSSGVGRKCRCDKAKVLEITTIDGKPVEAAASMYNKLFVYILGETVGVCDFDECRWHECTRGIHFFMTREEAVEYRGLFYNNNRTNFSPYNEEVTNLQNTIL